MLPLTKTFFIFFLVTIFGYVGPLNIGMASKAITYIDAVAVNIGGLVTQVSFYASKQCQDNNIYFGAFSAQSAISSSTQFHLTAESNPLSLDLSSNSDNSMQLVTISLCISSSNPVGCQGQAFTISSGQYFGSYAPQCIMGYTPVSSSVYPSTYYQTSNPFPSGAQTTATYINNYQNVVLQYATVQPTSESTSLFCIPSIPINFIVFFRFVHLNKQTYSMKLFVLLLFDHGFFL
jgi:hypothetical protein